MGFLEIVFPEDIAYGAVGGPSYDTSIVTFRNGREQRNMNWPRGFLRWDVAHGVKDAAQMRELENFFRTVRGRAYGFRFKDWTDYRLEQELIGHGNGTQTQFQLTKRYSFAGANDEVRPIRKIKPGTVAVWLNGIPQSSGWSINTNTGLLTFATAPPNGHSIRVSCEFYVPARFDTDVMRKSLEDYNLLTWGNIPVVEIVPPDET